MNRRWIASAAGEALGTGTLVCIVVGSGVAASSLSEDVGVQLLANSLATALGLAVLIAALGPVSGAHLNPVVSVVDGLRRAGPRTERIGRVVVFVVAQLVGAVGGSLLANAMFEVPQGVSTTARDGIGVLLGEVVATAGLITVVLLAAHHGVGRSVALWVAAYIGSAYWFTSSTSFANPAVTVGRMFTDTFAGISPASAVPFVLAQLAGAAIGVLVVSLLTAADTRFHTATIPATPPSIT